MVKILTLLLVSGQISAMTIPLNLGELCTSTDKDFKEFRYKEQVPICERNVSPSIKDKVCKRDGINDRTNFLVNHVVSLFAGGNNSMNNLYCQPKSRNTADKEFELYKQLKEDKIGIQEVRYKLKIMNDKLINELNND